MIESADNTLLPTPCMPSAVPAAAMGDPGTCAPVAASPQQSKAPGQRLSQLDSRKVVEALKRASAASAATRALLSLPPRQPPCLERAISPPPPQQQQQEPCAEECAIAAYMAAHPHEPVPVLLMCRCKGKQRSSSEQRQRQQQQQQQQQQQPQQRLPFSHGNASIVRLVMDPSTSSDASTSASTTAGPRRSESPVATAPFDQPLHPSPPPPPPRQRHPQLPPQRPHQKKPPPLRTSYLPKTTFASSASTSSASSASSSSSPSAAQSRTAVTVGVGPSSPSYNRNSRAIHYLGGSVTSQSCRRLPSSAPPSPLPTTAPAVAVAAVPPSFRSSTSSAGAATPTAVNAAELQSLLGGGPIPTRLIALQSHPDLASELSARRNNLLYKATVPPSGVPHPTTISHDASRKTTSSGAPPRQGRLPQQGPPSLLSPQLSILPNIPLTFYTPPVLPGKRASTWAKRPSSSSDMGPPHPPTAATRVEVPSPTSKPSSTPPPLSPTALCHPRHSPSIHENPFRATAEHAEVLALVEPNPLPPVAPQSPLLVRQSEHRTDAPSLTEATSAKSGRTAATSVPQNGRIRSADKTSRIKKDSKITGASNGLPRQNLKIDAPLSQLDRLQKGVREAHRRRLRQKPGTSPTPATVRSFALLYNECSVRTVSQWVTTQHTPHSNAIARENPSSSNFLPTAPAQFRKCNHCGQYGHYEVLCPALPPEYAAAIEYDLARPCTPPPRPPRPSPPPPHPTSVSKTSGEKSRKVSIELCEGFLFEQSNKLQSSAKRPRKGPVQSNTTNSTSGSYPNPLLESTQLDLLVVEAATDVRFLV